MIERTLTRHLRTAAALANAGNGLLAQGRISDALPLYERSRALSREAGERRFEAAVAALLAIATDFLGRFDLSLRHSVGEEDADWTSDP